MLDLFKKNGPPGPADPQLLQVVKAYIDAHFEPEAELTIDTSLCEDAAPMAFTHLSAEKETREEYPVQYQKISSGKHSAAKNASYSMPDLAPMQKAASAPLAGSAMPKDLGDYLDRIDAGFSETLLKLIDESGEKDSTIYKRANVDRKLFSKIRSNPAYKPSKATALAFALALRLDLDETNELIGRAGYVLSHSSKADLAVECFIKNQIYDIGIINEVLYAYDLPLIGGAA
ncbi:MAG: hypothetical protein II474_01545 [Firmicutes bacterium]|nr:hypothetical protein [Bacillota bacterium]